MYSMIWSGSQVFPLTSHPKTPWSKITIICDFLQVYVLTELGRGAAGGKAGSLLCTVLVGVPRATSFSWEQSRGGWNL